MILSSQRLQSIFYSMHGNVSCVYLAVLNIIMLTAGFTVNGAPDTLYANGIFKTNVAATIKATPLSLVSGTLADTTYTFQTGSGNSVPFSLPYAINITGIYDQQNSSNNGAPLCIVKNGFEIYMITIPRGAGSGNIAVYSLQGEKLITAPLRAGVRASVDLSGYGDGVYIGAVKAAGFNQRIKFCKHAGNLTMDAAGAYRLSGTHDVAVAQNKALYKIDLQSMASDNGDTSGIQLSLSEGDNGTISWSLPALSASEKFKKIFSKQDYGVFFPNRYGLGVTNTSGDGNFDFYTYESLLKAIDEMAKIRVEIWLREGVDYCCKIKWENKVTGEKREMITHEDYDADWNQGVPEIKYGDIDYACFCNEGTLEIRKRELAAFFGNISHETTGMGEADSTKTWGLYWREEVEWQTNPNNNQLGYVDNSCKMYPPTSGKSYHGRGPIQISWNYNYGQVSEFLYGDKTIFLKNPEKVLGSVADVSFMTAIWFWMTPQFPKPSCHDVITEKWTPNAADITAGRDKSRFGNTINIINGNLECGTNNPNDYRVVDRIGFYKRYAKLFNVTIESYCNCEKMKPY